MTAQARNEATIDDNGSDVVNKTNGVSLAPAPADLQLKRLRDELVQLRRCAREHATRLDGYAGLLAETQAEQEALGEQLEQKMHERMRSGKPPEGEDIDKLRDTLTELTNRELEHHRSHRVALNVAEEFRRDEALLVQAINDRRKAVIDDYLETPREEAIARTREALTELQAIVAHRDIYFFVQRCVAGEPDLVEGGFQLRRQLLAALGQDELVEMGDG